MLIVEQNQLINFFLPLHLYSAPPPFFYETDLFNQTERLVVRYLVHNVKLLYTSEQ